MPRPSSAVERISGGLTTDGVVVMSFSCSSNSFSSEAASIDIFASLGKGATLTWTLPECTTASAPSSPTASSSAAARVVRSISPLPDRRMRRGRSACSAVSSEFPCCRRGSSCAGASEVETGLLRRRRPPRHMVGEDRPKARPRLDPRIPFFRRLVLLPWYVAQIIEARQVRRGADVGEREMVAGEPAPPLDEIADVVEMVRQIRVPGADRQRVRLAPAPEAFHHLLAEQVLGHF